MNIFARKESAGNRFYSHVPVVPLYTRTVHNCMYTSVPVGVRCVPVGTGWVIDGFPTSPAQAVLLEKALTGYDDSSKVEAKVTQLAPDPHPVAPPPEPGSGIDVAIVLQLDDEICLKRAAGRTRNYNRNKNNNNNDLFHTDRPGS